MTSSQDDIADVAARLAIESPSESQRELMSELGIIFLDGVYRLGPYRYDRLADAVEYARRGFRT